VTVSRDSKSRILIFVRRAGRPSRLRAKVPIIFVTLFAAFMIPAFVSNVHAATCPPGNCQVQVGSNVPSVDGNIWVEIDNNTSNVVPLPQTFNFGYNSTHTITVLNATFTGASTAGHYVWKEWANYYGTTTPGTIVWTTSPTIRICPGNQCVPNGDIYNYTGTGGFTAVFDKQYKTSISFTDAIGGSLAPNPVSLTLQPQGNGSPITLTSYTNQYVSASNYTVSSAQWEGATIEPAVGSEMINLANGPATVTVSLQAYPETIQIVDMNNNPVSGANVTVSFVNGTGTSKNYITDHNGNVHLGDVPLPTGTGSFGVTVRYQNQEFGPYTPTVTGSSTVTLQIAASSSSPNTTTTAIVLLAIFGIALFMILLAIKVRKPAAPPQIGAANP